jgi:outer membrane immunogenic protein
MRKSLFAIAASLAMLGSPALAADMGLPLKAPPLPPIPNWAGFYVGGQVGAAWNQSQTSETTAFVPPATGNSNTTAVGVIGGAHAGYNWQFGSIVVGPEVDFEGSSVNKTNSCLVQDAGAGNVAPGTCFPPTYAFSVQMPWEISVRGRLGYAWGNTLIYATGGVAFAQFNTSYSTGAGYFPLGAQSFSQTVAGGTVGAGLEYAFAAHWIGRLEYRYTGFGPFTNANTSGGGFWNGYTDRYLINQNAVRIGLSYLFH